MDLFRRAALVTMIQFFTVLDFIFLQLFVVIGLLFGYLLLNIVFQPYTSKRLNFLVLVWISTSVLTLLSAIVFQSSLQETEETIFAFVVFVSLLGSMAYTFYVYMKDLRHATALIRFQNRHQISYFDVQEQNLEFLTERFPQVSHKVLKFYNFLSLDEKKEFLEGISGQTNYHETLGVEAHTTNPDRGQALYLDDEVEMM